MITEHIKNRIIIYASIQYVQWVSVKLTNVKIFAIFFYFRGRYIMLEREVNTFFSFQFSLDIKTVKLSLLFIRNYRKKIETVTVLFFQN